MSQVTRLLISGIVHCLGECRDISELANAIPGDVMADLLQQQLSGFCVLKHPLSYTMEACILDTLRQCELEAADIDAVVLVTESYEALFDDDGYEGPIGFRHVVDQMQVFLLDLGFRRASFHCVSLGGCANLLQAFTFAEALIQRRSCRHILVVAGEKRASHQSRLIRGAAVASDGAVSFVLSKELTAHKTAFRVDYVAISPYEACSEDCLDDAKSILAMFRTMRHAAADCYEECSAYPTDFRWAITGHYNAITSISHGNLLGFSPEHVFMNSVGKLGHVACDPMMNLGNLASEGLIDPSDRVLLFLSGPNFCGPIAVTAICL